MAAAKEMGAPYQLVVEVAQSGKLPVVNFAAGGIATPADAALMMPRHAAAIVKAVTHYNDPQIVADVSKGLGGAMPGLEIAAIPEAERLAVRGW